MKLLLLANTDWYLYNYRLPLAISLRENGHEVMEKINNVANQWVKRDGKLVMTKVVGGFVATK